MIAGVGVDILHLPRLAKLAGRQSDGISRLAKRILSDRERLDFDKIAAVEHQTRLGFLAVR